MTAIFQPIPVFNGKDGLPLDGGLIYIGEAGQDARQYPIAAYRDEALTQPWAQPIRTVAGFPSYQGAPSKIYIAGFECTVTVLERDGEIVLNNADGTAFVNQSGIVMPTRAAMADLQPSGNAAVFLSESGRQGYFMWSSADNSANVTSDPGQGIYVPPASDTTGASGAWVRTDGLTGDLWASWFGVDAAAADNSTAFQNIMTYARSKTRTTVSTNNRAAGIIVRLGAGDFMIKTPRALLDSTGLAGRTTGFRFIGLGAPVTTIKYQPTTAGPLIYNDDFMLDIKFEGISFFGYVADDATGASDWMYSYNNNGGAQGFHASDCWFGGRWRYGVNLQGLNNNSEHSYNRCYWSTTGNWLAWLYAPAVGSGGSDQFLNYWFSDCRYWASYPWIDMASGGHVKLIDCDVSGYTPSVDTYLFNLRTPVHALGVTNFEARGLRAELKSQYAHVMYCEWEQGQIIFDGLDCSSQATFVTPSVDHFHFKYSSSGGPVIAFRSCRFMGKAKYEVAISTWDTDRRVTYDSCEFLNWDRFTDYFTFVGGINPGGLPVIRGTNCKTRISPFGLRLTADFDLNWKGLGTTTRSKFAAYTAASGLGVRNTASLRLRVPVGTFIRKFVNYAPSGHVGEAAAVTFTLTSDGVTIATFTTPGFNSAGYASEVDVNFQVETTAQEDIILTTTATQSSALQVNAIEYV